MVGREWERRENHSYIKGKIGVEEVTLMTSINLMSSKEHFEKGVKSLRKKLRRIRKAKIRLQREMCSTKH